MFFILGGKSVWKKLQKCLGRQWTLANKWRQNDFNLFNRFTTIKKALYGFPPFVWNNRGSTVFFKSIYFLVFKSEDYAYNKKLLW